MYKSLASRLFNFESTYRVLRSMGNINKEPIKYDKDLDDQTINNNSEESYLPNEYFGHNIAKVFENLDTPIRKNFYNRENLNDTILECKEKDNKTQEKTKEEKNVKQEDLSDEENNNSDDDNDNEGGIMIPIKEFLKEILKTPRHE